MENYILFDYCNMETLCDVSYECMLNSTVTLQINQLVSYRILCAINSATISDEKVPMSRIFE